MQVSKYCIATLWQLREAPFFLPIMPTFTYDSPDGRVPKSDTWLPGGTLASDLLVPSLRSQCGALGTARTGSRSSLVARVRHAAARSFCEEATRMGVAALRRALPAEGGVVVSSGRLQGLRTKLFAIRCQDAFEASPPLTPAAPLAAAAPAAAAIGAPAAMPPATAPPAPVVPAACLLRLRPRRLSRRRSCLLRLRARRLSRRRLCLLRLRLRRPPHLRFCRSTRRPSTEMVHRFSSRPRIPRPRSPPPMCSPPWEPTFRNSGFQCLTAPQRGRCTCQPSRFCFAARASRIKPCRLVHQPHSVP